MKILFAIPDMCLGGSATVVHDIIKNWPSKKDILYLVLFFSKRDNRYDDVLCGNSVKLVQLNKRGLIDLKFLFSLRKEIRKIKPDIISSHLTATFWLKIAGATKFCTIYHTIHSEPICDLPRIYRIFLKSDIKNERIKLIGCCKYISNKANLLYKKKCYTITNGIDFENLHADKKPHDKTNFLYVGRLEPIKNVVSIINAFGLIDAKNASLIIAGYGSEEKNVFDAISACSNKSKIIFLGKVNDVSSVYDECDVLCLPSKREGMPITILEAIKNGLAFITSNVGGIPEFVLNGYNGFVLEDLDVRSIASCMSELLNNKGTIDIFKKNSLTLLPYISAKKMACKYCEILKGIHKN